MFVLWCLQAGAGGNVYLIPGTGGTVYIDKVDLRKFIEVAMETFLLFNF